VDTNAGEFSLRHYGARCYDIATAAVSGLIRNGPPSDRRHQ
jgi:hypothetical protein